MGVQAGNASAWAGPAERRAARLSISRAAHGMLSDLSPLHDWSRFLLRATNAAAAVGSASSCAAQFSA